MGLGHFFPEVWLPEESRWVVVDGNCDLCFVDKNGQPKSAVELYPNRRELKQWASFGPGFKHQAKRLEGFIERCVKKGATYRNIGYWRRNDFFTHPEKAATYHGSLVYCEPDIVWIQGDEPLLEAFPYDCRR